MGRKSTETARALGEILSGRNVSQVHVAASSGYSQPYVNQIANGRRRASPEWIDAVAKALNLNAEESKILHVAAAKDHGFKIDLTK
jgi:transcriptional regulator with XRE-family HTH domain